MVGPLRKIFISNAALERLNATLELFDFFMRDDEPLDRTLARFIYLIDVGGNKYQEMCRKLKERTGLSIEWEEKYVSNANELPEAGANDVEALTFLKSLL